MLAPNQIQNCCQAVESRSASGIGSIPCWSTDSALSNSPMPLGPDAEIKTPPRRLCGVQLCRLKATRRKAAQLGARVDLELEEDLAEVILHSARADEQLRTDLGVGETVP